MSADAIRFVAVVHRVVLSRLANQADREFTITLKVPFMFKNHMDKLAAFEGPIIIDAVEQ